MRIIFFGNGDFGVSTLINLYESKHDLLLLVTNKAKKKDRKQNIIHSNIHKIAIKNSINVIDTDDISSISFHTKIESLKPDLFIVISYKIIPESLLSIPEKGAINLHASLLPQYRGSAPIQRSLMDGSNLFGLTSFYLKKGIDNGDLIFQKKFRFNDKATYTDIHNNLAKEGPEIISESINLIKQNNFKPKKQNSKLTTYAKKINKIEYRLNFKNSSKNIHNHIRALTKPGCYCFLNKKRIKLYDTYYLNKNNNDLYKIGDFWFINKEMHIKCQKGVLIVNSIQIEGRKIISTSEFMNRNFQKMTLN